MGQAVEVVIANDQSTVGAAVVRHELDELLLGDQAHAGAEELSGAPSGSASIVGVETDSSRATVHGSVGRFSFFFGSHSGSGSRADGISHLESLPA
jgi:hypothetical protein